VEGQAVIRIRVVGDPAVGIQEVWITYTAFSGPFAGRWQSLNLSQNWADTTTWEGTLDLEGTNPEVVRFIGQAVNGVGLVSLVTNLGTYYIPGVDPNALGQATALSLEVPVSSGPYGSEATFNAILTTENGEPLAGRVVIFGVGSVTGIGVTNEAGRATATIPLLGIPGLYQVQAIFGGMAGDSPSSASGDFNITQQTAIISLDEPGDLEALLVATLEDAEGRRLFDKSLLFEITVLETNEVVFSENIITDFIGRALLTEVPLEPGTYNVTVSYVDPNEIYVTSPVTTLLTVEGELCSIIRDDFNRSGKNIGSNWAGAKGVGNYKLVDGAEVEALSGKPIYWKSPSFGPDQEACVTLTKIDPKGYHSLLLKVQNVWNRGAIEVYYEAKEHGGIVGIKTYEKKKGWRILQTFPMQLQAGDQLAGQALSDGTVKVFVNRNFVGETNGGSFFANKGGRIGLWFVSPKIPHARFDDFGGQ